MVHRAAALGTQRLAAPAHPVRSMLDLDVVHTPAVRLGNPGTLVIMLPMPTGRSARARLGTDGQVRPGVAGLAAAMAGVLVHSALVVVVAGASQRWHEAK